MIKNDTMLSFKKAAARFDTQPGNCKQVERN